jgi:hypothetical protein
MFAISIIVSMADNSARITAINNILAAGVSSTTVDGQSVSYDFETLRRERAILIDLDDVASKKQKSLFLGCDLGGRV